MDRGANHLSQSQTVSTILHKLNLQTANPYNSAYNDKAILDGNTDSIQISTDMAPFFRQTLGDLRYVADSMRPDIFHLLNKLSTHLQTPSQHHWNTLKRLLRYLQDTQTHGLLYNTQPPVHILQSFSDTGYANSRHRKSSSGVVHNINSTPIQ